MGVGGLNCHSMSYDACDDPYKITLASALDAINMHFISKNLRYNYEIRKENSGWV